MEAETSTAIVRREHPLMAPVDLGSDGTAKAVLAAIASNDYSRFTDEMKVRFLTALCRSVGLNPATAPIKLMNLSGRVVPYADKGCAEQLRGIHGISITIVERAERDGLLIVHARAQTPDGRQDEAIGAVSVQGLKGDALAVAMMKAETKAKRRVTLSMVGLGLLDESEIETARSAASQPESTGGPRPSLTDRLAPKPAPIVESTPPTTVTAGAPDTSPAPRPPVSDSPEMTTADIDAVFGPSTEEADPVKEWRNECDGAAKVRGWHLSDVSDVLAQMASKKGHPDVATAIKSPEFRSGFLDALRAGKLDKFLPEPPI